MGIGIAFIKCAVPDIPYAPVLEWSRTNPGLVDESGTPILEGREPKRPRRLGRADNDMEMVIEDAFASMNDGMDDMEDQKNIAEVDVYNLVNEVVNEVNLGELEADTIESRIDELRKKHAEEIREYNVKILDLENQVATLTMGEADSSSSSPTNINLQSLQAERDTTLEEAMIAKSQALKVCTMNQVMQGKMKTLQKKVVDMQQQLQVINEVVLDYKAKIDLDVLGQLEEQNARLKKFCWMRL